MSTPKPVQAFASCFMSHQESRSRPVSFILYGDGGRLSNEGASGVSNPYRIRVIESAQGNQLRLFISRRDEAEERHLLNAIKSCS